MLTKASYKTFKWTKASESRIAILKDYEPIQPYVLMALAERAKVDTFIDVGANIGVYSIFMSSLDCIKVVHAFEPSRTTFVQLSENVKLNFTGKVSVYDKALSSSAQVVRFGIVAPLSGANSIVSGSIHAADKFVREHLVECLPLDALRIETPGKLCVKIDVEGHERNVLIGAKELLNRKAAILQLEVYGDITSISDLLAGWGYRKLFAIGPDCYYTNIRDLTDDDVISVFENASTALVEANLETRLNRSGPIKLRLPWVYLEVSGSLGSIARTARRWLRAG